MLAALSTGRINGSDSSDAAQQVQDALEMLTVISRVGVVANAVEDDNQGTVNMTFDVHFHFGPLVTHPLNLGAMPLFGLQTGGIVGLVATALASLRGTDLYCGIMEVARVFVRSVCVVGNSAEHSPDGSQAWARAG